MEFFALGITLVLSQLVTMAIAYFVAFKLFTSKKILKKYFRWINEIMNMSLEEEDDL